MAEGNLAACLPVTLRYEGGLSTRRDDPGNWTGGTVGDGELRGTKFGIAASSHPTLDIASLTRVEASAIYDREYWTPAGCEALAAGLDLSHFDATVNSGRGRSARWLAAARQDAGADVVGLIHAYAAARLASLESFRTWATFGKGWAARVAGVEAASLTMALGPGARPAIVAAGAIAASRATAAGAAATTSATIGAGATIAAANAHPVLAGGVALLSFLGWLGSAFHAGQANARAATLAHAAAQA